MGPAREKVRVARALAELPKISAAMREGRVSYSKVRAMTRIATPANEERLLEFALQGSAAHVERLVRSWRRVERLDAAERDRQRRVDALRLVAESALAGGLDPGSRGDRYLVTVHVDAAVLVAGGPLAAAEAEGMAMLEDEVEVFRGNVSSAGMRQLGGGDARGWRGPSGGGDAQTADHFPGLTAGTRISRPGLPFRGLRGAGVRRAPCATLGRWRADGPRESRATLSAAPRGGP